MELRVSIDAAGERLDTWLAEAAGMSRSQIGLRIDAGDVLIEGRLPLKAGQKLRGGERISLVVPPPPPSEAAPEALPIDIVYEDAHLVVVNKAADMVVHPSPGHDRGTLVNALVHRYGTLAPDLGAEDGRPRPGIVHRLDRGTSGLLVVARDAPTRDALMAQIAARTVRRQYLAIVHGPKLEDAGTFRTLYGRHPTDRKRFTSRLAEGKVAVTHFSVIARARTVALVLCRLETGRTHQIRVHFADHGHPVAGDTLYGGDRRASGAEGHALAGLTRQALHAWRLAFVHPATGEAIAFEAPLPPDLAELVRSLFGDVLS